VLCDLEKFTTKLPEIQLDLRSGDEGSLTACDLSMSAVFFYFDA
jgi:hypothetical protein